MQAGAKVGQDLLHEGEEGEEREEKGGREGERNLYFHDLIYISFHTILFTIKYYTRKPLNTHFLKAPCFN